MRFPRDYRELRFKITILPLPYGPNADLVCFTDVYLTVPNDPHLSIAAGQGVYRPGTQNYDSSMPSTFRCDAAEGTRTHTSGGMVTDSEVSVRALRV